MKCEMLSDGFLYITTESNLESYAMRKWIEENYKEAPNEYKNITFDYSFKEE